MIARDDSGLQIFFLFAKHGPISESKVLKGWYTPMVPNWCYQWSEARNSAYSEALHYR